MDVTEENDLMEGPTSSIFVGRDTLWNDAITELSAIENLRSGFLLRFAFMEKQEKTWGDQDENFSN